MKCQSVKIAKLPDITSQLQNQTLVTKGGGFVDQIYSEIEILLKVRKLRILSIPPNPLLVALIFSPQLNSNLVFMSLRKRKASFATKGLDLSERCKELLAERKGERNTCEVDG